MFLAAVGHSIHEKFHELGEKNKIGFRQQQAV